jgi:hypothetical protein
MNSPQSGASKPEIIAWLRFSPRIFSGEGILFGDDASRPYCAASPY